MIDAGLILKWTDRHWPRDNHCEEEGSKSAMLEHRVTFLETRGAWNLFGIGLAAAAASFIFECAWKKYTRYKGHINLFPRIA